MEEAARGARSRSSGAVGGSPCATAGEEREDFERTLSAEKERCRVGAGVHFPLKSRSRE